MTTQRSPWLMVAASGAGIAVSSGTIGFYLMGLMIDPISAERGWDSATVVFATTVFALVQVITVPAGGLLVDRWGVRRVLLPSMALFAFTLMGLSLVQTPLQFYLGFACIGVVGGGMSSLIFIRAICTWFDKQRGLAIGAASSGMGAALVVVPPLSAWLLYIGNWRLVYIVMGAIVLFGTLPLVAGLVHERKAVTPTQITGGEGMARREILADFRFWLFITVFFLLSATVNSVALYLVSFARAQGFTSLAVTAASCFGGAMVVGRLATGVLVDRFDPRKVAATMIALVAVANFCLMLSPSGALLLICATLVGLGAGSDGDLMTFLVARYFGLRAFGSVSGFGFGAYILAASTFPFLTGLWIDEGGSYSAAFFVGGVMTLAAAAMALMLGSPPPVAQETAPMGAAA